MLRIKRRNSFEDFSKAVKSLSKEEMKTYVGGTVTLHNPNEKKHFRMADNSPFYDGPEEDPYSGGWSSSAGNFDTSISMDEVVVVGHQPKRSYSDLIFDIDDIGRISRNMDIPYSDFYNDTYRNLQSSQGSGGGSFSSASGVPIVRDESLPSGPLKISKETLEVLKGSMDENLYKFIEDLWKKDAVRENPDSSKNPFSAYYDSEKNILYITNPDFASEHTLAHEYAHYLQDQNNALAPKGSDIGDFNNEMQADILATIYSYAFQGDFIGNVWLNDETKKEFRNGLEIDSKNRISVRKEFWNNLNDNGYMLKLQSEWRSYHEGHPTSSPTNLAGEKRDWNYNWQNYFDKLGIKHP